MSYSMNQQVKILNSVDEKHRIKISWIDEIGWFSIEKIDVENSKTLMILIKDILKIFANNRIKYIKQYIGYSDVELFRYSEFIEYDDYITVTTPIDKFPIEIVGVLGLNPI